MIKQDKYVEQMLKCFEQMDIVDIMGFGNIVGAQEVESTNEENGEEKFVEYITEILYKYSSMPRVKRKQLLKLAKTVVAANKDIIKGMENTKSQSEQK